LHECGTQLTVSFGRREGARGALGITVVYGISRRRDVARWAGRADRAVFTRALMRYLESGSIRFGV